MRKYIINGDQFQTPIIYDCYGVSNHYGNMGFGHYTAFCKNPLDNQWYEFDDGRVTMMKADQVATANAYNIFYRKREWHNKNMEEGINFDKLAIRP